MSVDPPASGRLATAAYRTAWAAALMIAAPYGLTRWIVHPGEMRERLGRWGRLPAAARGALWLHAASLGETRAALPLVAALRDRAIPSVMTVFTPTARAHAAEIEAAGALAVRFAPLDFGPAIARVFRQLAPRALLVLETEIWPILLRAAQDDRVPTAFVSARLSRDGWARTRRLRAVLQPLLARVAVAAQTAEDAARWRDLGVPPERVRVTGNLKYQSPRGPIAGPLREKLRAGWRRVVLLGSLRSGEIPAILDAVQTAAPRADETLWVFVPRHPERTTRPLTQALKEQLPLVIRSAAGDALLPPRSTASGPTLGLVVATIGELRRFYEIADLAFVGGTLAPIGGHNLFEPAELGVPVLFGPHTSTVAETAEMLLRCGGGCRVSDGRALGREIAALLGDADARRRAGTAALEAAGMLGGALTRTLASLLDWGFPVGSAGRASETVVGGVRGTP